MSLRLSAAAAPAHALARPGANRVRPWRARARARTLLCGALALAALAGCERRARPDAGEPESAASTGGAMVRDADGRVTRSFSLPAHSSPTEPACTTAVRLRDLPHKLSESSGIAASRAYPGILWTHDDSDGKAAVYALDTDGRVVGTVDVPGAQNVDWEDIAVGPCAAGQAGSCLYIGDIGDNDRNRPDVTVYRVPEPDPRALQTASPERISFVYPGGPRDAEALFVLPDASINIVTKGRHGPVALYRFAGRPAPGDNLLTRVQLLDHSRVTLDRQVTGADATPDGRWVAIRTYGWLEFYHPAPDGTLDPALTPPGLPLEDAGEPQGEGVAFGGDGTVWLSTEAGPGGGHAFVSRLGCRFP